MLLHFRINVLHSYINVINYIKYPLFPCKRLYVIVNVRNCPLFDLLRTRCS